MFRAFYFFVYLFVLGSSALFSKKMRFFWRQRIYKSKFSKGNFSEGKFAQKSPLWIHCSSGEFEYAKPVLKRLKARGESTLVSFFSPTYSQSILRSPWVDCAEPLPLDLPAPITEFLDRHKPQALWIARTDLWPELIYQCRRKGIPVLLFSASRSRLSGLRKWLFWFYSKLLNRLQKIYVVSPEDEQELKNLGVTADLSVLGDTRYDQVIDRLETTPPLQHSTWKSLGLQPEPILVAGSTWPEDEKALLPALSSFIQDSQLRLILVPHEIDSAHLENIESLLKAHGLSFQKWTQELPWTSPVLLVDQVGLLADLYPFGDIAFVGGSFRSKVHSVMEALAAGCLTLVGPYHQNNREALSFRGEILPGGLHMVEVIPTGDHVKNLLNQILKNQKNHKKLISEEVKKRRGASDLLLSLELQNTPPPM